MVVTVGAPDEPIRSVTTHIFHRGMDGDINTHTGSQPPPDDVDTPSSEGPTPDHDRLWGAEREMWVAGADGIVYNRQVTTYGDRAISGFGDAWQVFVTELKRDDPTGRTVTDYVYDDHPWYRRLESVRELGRVDSTWANIDGPDGRADHRCTTTEYTPASDRFLIGLAHRTAHWNTLSCDAGLLADTRTYYDSQPVPAVSSPPAPVAPTRGNPTATWRATGSGVVTQIVANPVVAVVSSVSYEQSGFAASPGWSRPLSMTDERNRTTSTSYTSFSGTGLATPGNHATETMTTTNPMGHSVAVRYDIYGRDIRTTDPNNRVSSACYDELGRVVRVFQPGMDGSDCAKTPSTTFSYVHGDVTPKHPTYVSEVPRWKIQTRTLFSKPGETGHPDGMGGQHAYVESWEHLDGFGNIVETQKASPVGGIILSRTVYDSMGQVRRRSDPFQVDGTPGDILQDPPTADVKVDNITISDPIGRPISTGTELYGQPRRSATTVYDGATVTENPMRYAGETTGFAPTVRHLDTRGKAWKIVEHDNAGVNAQTLHRYNQRDELVEIIDDAGNSTTMGYNQLGWRTRIDDPNQGATETRYLPTGVVRDRTDAKGTTILSTYDDLDRVVGEHLNGVADGNRLAVYSYDTVTGATGQLVRTDSYQPAGTLVATEELTDVEYAGRPSERTISVPSAPAGIQGPFRFKTDYNRAGQASSETFPGVTGSDRPHNERLDYRTSTLGQPEAVSSSVDGGIFYVGTATDGIAYHDDGRQFRVPLTAPGTPMYLEQYYDEDNRPNFKTAQLDLTPGDPHDWLTLNSYGYDASGNPTVNLRVTGSPADAVPSEFECYRYDARQRLSRAFTAGDDDTCAAYDAAAPAPFNHTYSYDKLTRFSVNAGRSYTYNTNKSGCANGTRASRPHAVSSGTAGGGQPAESLTYTCTGAIATRTAGADTWTYTWDERDRLTAVKRNTELPSRNIYTATGDRIVRYDPNSTTFVYLGNTEIRRLATGVTDVARIYPHGVLRDYSDTIIYQAGNQQDSIVATLEAMSGTQTQTRYHPYGNRRSGGIRVDRGFLNETEDRAQDLNQLNARSYQDTLAHFTKPDPLLDIAEPASLSPYIYTAGTPITLGDPTGLFPAGCGTGDCGWSGNNPATYQGGTSAPVQRPTTSPDSWYTPSPPQTYSPQNEPVAEQSVIVPSNSNTGYEGPVGGPGTPAGNPASGNSDCYGHGSASGNPSSPCYQPPPEPPNWGALFGSAVRLAFDYTACSDFWSGSCAFESAAIFPWFKGAKSLKLLKHGDEASPATRVLGRSDDATAAATSSRDDALKYATSADKLDHIFDPKHRLGPLAEQFGSREAVVEQVLRGVQGQTPSTGVFEISTQIGGQTVVARGAVVDGTVKLGTVFTP